MEDNFIWTEELVKEFYNHWWPANQNFLMDKAITDFKQSKSSAKATDDVKECITAFRDIQNGNILRDGEKDFFMGYTRTSHLHKKEIIESGKFEIYSALSKDKVEFRVDEKTNQGIIQQIGISDNKILVRMKFDKNVPGSGADYPIDLLTKAEEKKPLFTVQDCNVYEGDKVFIALHNLIEGSCAYDSYSVEERIAEDGMRFWSDRVFLTRDAAEKYILYRNKTISYQDILDLCKEHFEGFNEDNAGAYGIGAVHLIERFKPKVSDTK